MTDRCRHDLGATTCWDCANPVRSRRPDPEPPFGSAIPPDTGAEGIWRELHSVLQVLREREMWLLGLTWAEDVVRRIPNTRNPGAGRQRDELIDLVFAGLRFDGRVLR